MHRQLRQRGPDAVAGLLRVGSPGRQPKPFSCGERLATRAIQVPVERGVVAGVCERDEVPEQGGRVRIEGAGEAVEELVCLAIDTAERLAELPCGGQVGCQYFEQVESSLWSECFDGVGEALAEFALFKVPSGHLKQRLDLLGCGCCGEAVAQQGERFQKVSVVRVVSCVEADEVLDVDPELPQRVTGEPNQDVGQV